MSRWYGFPDQKQWPHESGRVPQGWYFHAGVKPEQLAHLKEGLTYRIGLPCDPTECFTLDGYLCCIYIEGGVKKAAYLKEADHFYPMDPWFLEWGDIGGVCYAHKTNNVSFNLSAALKMASAKKPASPDPTSEPKKETRRGKRRDA